MRNLIPLLMIVSMTLLPFTSLHATLPFPADANAYAGPDDNICEGESFHIVQATASNYVSLFWESSGNGVFDDPTLLHPVYYPAVGETGPVTLTLTAYAIAPGSDASDDMILTIYDGPEASFTISPPDSLCDGEPVNFYGTSTTQIVSWHWDFDDGITSAIQNPIHIYQATGFYQVSLIVINTDGCSDTVTNIVIVTQLPICDFTMSPNDTACVNEVVTFNGMASNIISWDWDLGDGNTANSQVVNHTYTTPGVYYISLIVTNSNSCQDTVIHDLVVADCVLDFTMTPSPCCENQSVAFNGFGGVGPYDYQWDFGDGNTATGQNVTHTYTQYLGFATVELTFGPDQVQQTLEVIQGAYAYAGPDDTICSGESYFLQYAVAFNEISRIWTSSGDGSFSDSTWSNPTYFPGPGDISNGTVDLTFTASNVIQCDSTDTMTLTIDPGPLVNAGADTLSCEGAPVMLNGYAEGQSSNTWTTAGDGTFDDPNILNATYTAGTNDTINGSVVLTLTAYATVPCVTDESDSLLLTFVTSPTADAGSDDMTCGNTPYILSGSASDYVSTLWTSGGDGIFNDPTLLNAEYTPGAGDINNGLVTLTLTAGATAPCMDAVDDMMLSILGAPMADAGDDDGICQGELYSLTGSASNYNTISWSTDGDGSFDDPGILDPTYTPGPGDIANRGATLSLEATPIAPCTIGMIDAMDLGIDPMVGDPDTPAGPTLVDSYITPTSEYEISTTPEANEYRWNIFPSIAGEISGEDTTGLIIWDPAFQGFAYVKVTVQNSCAFIISDSLEIEVSTSVGLAHHALNDLKVKIVPNPNRGEFSVSMQGIQQALNLTLYDYYGNIVKQVSIGTTGNFKQHFNLKYLPKGIYIMNLLGSGVAHSEKFIIQ